MERTLIILITYNAEKFIQKVLKSLLSCNLENFEILVIDNNSRDNTVNLVKHLGINIIRNAKNLGYGQASNIGFKYALKNNFDYVVLLNQDIIVEPDTIAKLINEHKQNTNYAILSPMQYNEQGTLDSFFAGEIIKISQNFITDLFNCRIKNIYSIDFINAAFWLLPKRTLKTVGGFNPLYFMYGEDTEYCRRVIYHGYKIGFVPHSKYIHFRENYYGKNENFFQKFLRGIVEYRRYCITNTINPFYPFIRNFVQVSKKIYIDFVKYLALLKLSFALKVLLGYFYYLITLPKVLKFRNLELTKQPTFLTDE